MGTSPVLRAFYRKHRYAKKYAKYRNHPNQNPRLPKPGKRGYLLDMTHLPYKAARNSGSPACGGAVRSVSD